MQEKSFGVCRMSAIHKKLTWLIAINSLLVSISSDSSEIVVKSVEISSCVFQDHAPLQI